MRKNLKNLRSGCLNNDLKDVILQTLEELEINEDNIESINPKSIDKEFLLKTREKLLVLFEGLQSANVTKIEQKLDLTINFLEYMLSEIDKQLK